MFASWLFARIILFLWFFKHMWEHRSDIADLRTDVKALILTVPPLLFILNVFWFGKIVRGLMKLLKGQLAKVMVLPNALNNGDTIFSTAALAEVHSQLGCVCLLLAVHN